MSKAKAVLISNPKTGRYTSNRRIALETLRDFLRSRDLDAELVSTARPGDATRIARDAANDGVRDVIVSGGDGTINEALQGLIGTNSRLSILPRGTANVLARELDLPLDSLRAAEVISRGKTQRIHVGCAIDEVTGVRRHFFLMAGIGLDASVVRRVHPTLKKHFGKAAFWFSGLSHLADWKPTPFSVEVNGETLPATFAAIGKAASYGGDLSVTPRAQRDQPDFEVCVISSHSRLRYLRLLPYVMRNGVPLNTPEVRYLRTTKVRATGEALVQVDGELIGKLPMRFEVAPETIDVIVP